MPPITFIPDPYDNRAWVFGGEDTATIKWPKKSEPGTVVFHKMPFKNLWPILDIVGFKSVRAAMPQPEAQAYIFSEDRYVKVNVGMDGADEDSIVGGRKESHKVEGAWDSLTELGFLGIDAALVVPGLPNDKPFSEFFVFCGHQYARIHVSDDKVIDGPRAITEGWPALNFATVDTILPCYRDSYKAFFFSGPDYVLCEIGANGAPDKAMNTLTRINNGWPELHEIGFCPLYNDVLLRASLSLEDKSKALLHTTWYSAVTNKIVEPTPLDLSRILGFESRKFHWGGSKFQQSGYQYRIDGSTTTDIIRDVGRQGILLHAGSKVGHVDSVSLTERLQLDEKLNAVRVLIDLDIHIPHHHIKPMLEHIEQHKLVPQSLVTSETTRHSDTKSSYVVTPKKGSTKDAARVTTWGHEWENHLKTWHSKNGSVTVGQFKANVGPASFGAHAIAAESKYGPFEVSVGAGVEFGAAFKDQSLTLDAGEIGITVGRKIGIHILGDTGFTVDLGKIFHWPW